MLEEVELGYELTCSVRSSYPEAPKSKLAES
jgi:hypothetical protein